MTSTPRSANLPPVALLAAHLAHVAVSGHTELTPAYARNVATRRTSWAAALTPSTPATASGRETFDEAVAGDFAVTDEPPIHIDGGGSMHRISASVMRR